MSIANFKRKPAREPVWQVEAISPADAEKYLARNAKNRSLSGKHVSNLAAAISRGEWEMNGDAIRFDVEGNLIDGQHRLSAVILADEPIKTIVIRNLSPTAFATIDANKVRGGGDSLSVSDIKQPNTTAAVLRLIHSSGYNSDWSGVIGSSRLSNKQILALMDDHPEAEVYSDIAYSGSRKHCRKILSPSLVAFGLCWLSRIDESQAQVFFDEIEYGENLTRHHPSNTLRTRLSDMAIAGQKSRVGKREVLGLLFKAWNARREGKDMRLARFIQSHSFPTPR